MTKKNKLDIIFGPVGSSAGIFIFITGLIITYFSLTGLVLVMIGAFFGFSCTCARIDFEKKKLRFSNDIFGIIPIGQWTFIKPEMKIGIKKSNKLWRAYSRSNRTLDLADNDYRIFLYDSDGKMIMPIQKSDNLASAKLNLENLSKQLGIGKM